MIDPVSMNLWGHRALFLGLAVTILVLRLLNLGPSTETLPKPDFLLCLVLAWSMRRPEYLPILLIALVILLEDFLLGRPPGLWAALVVLSVEYLKGRSMLTRELNFVTEWMLIALLIIGMFITNRFILAVFMVPQPGFGPASLQAFGSVLAYPLVVFLSRVFLELRKPAMGEIDPSGRRL